MKAEERLATLKAKGVNTDNYFIATAETGDGVLLKNEAGKLVVVPLEDEVEEAIYANGYVRNTMLHRRWVMGQMFHALNSKNGYNDWLKRHGYNYQWKMVLEEIIVIAKLEKTDPVAFGKRVMFFDKMVVANMLLDYQKKLSKYIDKLPTRHCKGIDYKRIPVFGDVFVTDIPKKVYKKIYDIAADVKYSSNYLRVYYLIRNFMRNYLVRLPWDTRMSADFIDAYKGSGAYFTCDNLIKFHGCRFEGVFDMEHSLEILNKSAKLYSLKGENYRLFAFMKKLIADNNFSWK